MPSACSVRALRLSAWAARAPACSPALPWRTPPVPACPAAPAGEGLDLFTLAFFGVFAAVFGNAILKSLRKKREFRECRRMLAKLKRASTGAWGTPRAGLGGVGWGPAGRRAAGCATLGAHCHPAATPVPLPQEQENLRSHVWSCPQSCPICLEDFTAQPPWRGGGQRDAAGGQDPGGDEASSSRARATRPGASGLDAEAGPSTSLLHGREVTSEEEFARMSAAGRAAVRRLRQRRHASEPGSSGGGGSGGWAQGAGPSTAAAGGGENAAHGRKERVPVTLGCGHTFCEPCEPRRARQGC